MDYSSLDLRLLVTLDALLEEGSVTGAARRLGVSQPAMSAQLARLRRLFGDPLLVASGRRMVPTTRAVSLREPLRAHLRELAGLVRAHASFDPATAQTTFRLAGSDHAHAILSADLVPRLRAEAPDCRLALLPVNADRIWHDLETARLDAAVVTSFAAIEEAKARFLLHETFALVQRRGHPRGDEPIDLDAFCALDHVLISPFGGGFTGPVDDALAQAGRRRRVVVSVPSFLMAPALVAQSDLVCVLPTRVAQGWAHALDVLPLPLDVAGFDLRLIWHPRRQHDPAHLWLRDTITDLMTGSGRRSPVTGSHTS